MIASMCLLIYLRRVFLGGGHSTLKLQTLFDSTVAQHALDRRAWGESANQPLGKLSLTEIGGKARVKKPA
jgi:hypothetical protein